MPKFFSRRSVLMLAAGAIAGGMLAGAPINDAAASGYYTGLVKGTAVGGYDPVAYFKQNKPVRGSKEFTTKWSGVTWRFSSAANRDAFVASPTSFAPKSGGVRAIPTVLG
ncbi:MAG: YHS domain-containing (seleno)protein, partial [Pseudomonadota bacterium]